MTVRPIVTGDDPVLRRKAATVTMFDDGLRDLVRDLFDTMYEAQGRGLAAPQVGVSQRVFVMDASWKEGNPQPLAVVNPEILSTEPPMIVDTEACLSLPGVAYRVGRPMVTELKWISPNGVKQSTKLWAVESRIACHEYDHLDGVLISDHGTEA